MHMSKSLRSRSWFNRPAIATEKMAFIQQPFETAKRTWFVLAALHTAHGIDHATASAEGTAANFGLVA
jgi:hypothetical protein